MRKLIMFFMALAIVANGFFIEAKAEEEPTPKGNSVSITVGIDDIYKDLVCLSKESYSLEGIEYTVYKDDGNDSEVGGFVLDASGKGLSKKSGFSFIDELADGDYYVEMTKGNEYFRLDSREYPFTLASTSNLPESISVTTVSEMYGKTSSNTYFSNNQYKLWTTSYGTGIFECGIAEVSAPTEIVGYGTHTISTSTSKVLDKASNELIYKILYYGRKGPKQWSGFTSGKYNVPFTSRDGKSYYKTNDSEALAAFITHVCLARAYNANSKWNLQWAQDGVNDYWKFVNSAENAPDDFVVYVWENYKMYGTQDMFFGFLMKDSDYQHRNLDIKIAPGFDPISLVLTKKNSSNVPVAKAGFEISYYAEGFEKLQDASAAQKVKSWVFETDEFGRLVINKANKISGDELFIDEATGNSILLPGSYIVKEIYAPKGYILADPFIIRAYGDIDRQPEYFNESGSRLLTNETSGFDLLEEHEGYAQVNKRAKNECSLSLANASYGIYMDEDCRVLAKDTNGNDAIIITNKDGNTNTIGIAPAEYYVKEIEAPRGFKLDETVYHIKVEENATATVESLEESYMIELRIHKADALTRKELAGAIYGVFDCNNKQIVQITLDENGEGCCLLPYCDQGYYLKELKAPEHYHIDENSYPISGSDSSDVKVELELVDDPKVFRLVVIKKNEVGNPLENVGFQIVNEKDEIVKDAYGNDCVGFTDSEGRLQFVLFEDGQYYLIETSTIEGYVLDETKRGIELTDESIIGKANEELEALTIEVYNYQIPVAETGDKEFIVFASMSVTSFVGIVIACLLKRKWIR